METPAAKNDQENVIARSASGRTLEVVKPGEKMELSAEKKAELPQKIKEAEDKYQMEIAKIEEKYESSGKEVINEKVRAIGLQRAQESRDSRVNFLNSLK